MPTDNQTVMALDMGGDKAHMPYARNNPYAEEKPTSPAEVSVTTTQDLRPYQRAAVGSLRESVRRGCKSPLLVCPTGSGKTVIAKAVIEASAAKGRRCLFLAPRRELIYQTSEKLSRAGIHHGVIMAGEGANRWARVQVACIPSLLQRCIRTHREQLPEADIVIVDEAHLSIADGTQEVLNAYPNAIKIGLTATPARTDGRGLGEFYDDLILGPSVQELTDLGFLVPARYFAPSKPDLEGVKIQAGDYNQKQLGERMQPLVGDVVTNWLRIARDRKTVVFSVNVAHSLSLCEQFRAAGIVAEHIDGRMENHERAAILRRLTTGKTQVICNCLVLTYGWDAPAISCAVLACPTKSVTKYLQMVGRVLRPSEGKADCIVIDHAGAVDDLGFADEPRPWSLDADTKIQDRQTNAKERKASKVTCGDCATVYVGRICPHCGKEAPARPPKAIDFMDGELSELDRAKKRGRKFTAAEKESFYGQLRHYAGQHCYSDGWASHKFRERMGVWPNSFKAASLVVPTPETLAWIRSRQIAWSKSKARQAA